MKNDIKKIINRVKIDKEMYKGGGFQFADTSTFDETATCFEDREKMADYITNLQEEINKLTAESTEWEERTYCWQDRAEDLQITIDKANNKLQTMFDNGNEETILDDLLELQEILQGSDKNE